MKRLVLLVDDRAASRDLVSTELEEAGYRVETARDGREGWAAFRRYDFDLVITDLRMPISDGMNLLQKIRSPESLNPQVPVILFSAYGSLSTAVAAGRSGATDFYPFSEAGIERLLARVKKILSAEWPRLPEMLEGESSAISNARDRILAIANLHAPVLIAGEPGTGRDAVAMHVHRLSLHADQPFLGIRCGSDAPLESLPGSGTVYLAGVERLSAPEQKTWWKRLRGLDGLGSSAPVRVIASCNQDLRLLAEDGRFDPEFGRWLARFTVALPPLRERLADLDRLIDALLRRVGERMGRRIERIQDAAMARLKAHPWHGNTSELEHCLELLVAYIREGEIREDHVDAVLADFKQPLTRIEDQRAREERELLLSLYKKHGTFSGVARELGITRNAAKYRFAKHDLLPSHRAAPNR
ncbi:MAG: sigma-54-dependent Fis family transcriptional regulator [Deltaproteobacteria bacterium]|nr:sigma-54-dependent Fis family transcriptional regulator [Deltaproteobacteria bacterium]